MLTTRAALDPGTAIGGYVVERLLGRGGMGDVYLARDLALNRLVALKVLPSDAAADPRRRERLQFEGRVLRSLRHPNICSVYGVGEENGLAFIAMEYIEGRTLHDVAIHERLPAERVRQIAVQLASALDEARRMRVVHRDLKGTNVMVTASGDVKVLDFGLAKLVAANEHVPISEVRYTDPGLVLGTAEYMSPEQALGREVDHRSDLFSFGVLLYELLTGSLPFRGATKMELFWSIVNRQPTPLEQKIPNIPSHLCQIVAKLLEKDSGRRYQTAQQVLHDLEQKHIDRERRERQSRSQLQWTRRLVGSSVGILASWVMMPIAFAVSAFAENAIETSPFLTASVWAGTDRIRDLQSVIDPAINPAAAWISNDGRVVYSTRRRHGRGALWVAAQGRKPRMIARDAQQAAVGPLGRNVYFTRDGAGGGLFKMPLDPARGQVPLRLAWGHIEHPVVAADGSRVVFARLGADGFALWSVPATGGVPYQLSAYSSAIPPVVSPDLKRMAIRQPRGVLVCDVVGCTNQQSLAVTSLVGWTPDNRGLTHTGEPGSANIWVTSIAEGTMTQITRFGDQVATSISWSPNGHRVAVTRQRTLTDLAWFNVLR